VLLINYGYSFIIMMFSMLKLYNNYILIYGIFNSERRVIVLA